MKENVFDKYVFDEVKLKAFGFREEAGRLVYACQILNGQFRLVISVLKDGSVCWDVFDEDLGEVYTLAKVFGAEGAFVGEVRLAIGAVFDEIIAQCGIAKVFKNKQTWQIMRYVKEKYGCDFEYLWEKTPDNAVFRRKDNQKWFGAVLTVCENRIFGSSDKKIEILDFRALPEAIGTLVDGKAYFPGYHMNKKHWVSVCLDGSVEIEEIFLRIDESFELAKK